MKQILCFGDSNTWGLIPKTNERYDWGTRWTSRLQEKLQSKEIRVIEEGLCGRTTVFEDVYRDHRNGLKTLPLILESHNPTDAAIIMLGTNDCKSLYRASAYQIAKGVELCVEKLLERIPKERILLISPIHLGKEVWRQEFDPEFDEESVEVSKQLKKEFEEVAKRQGISFLAAADYVEPSETDQEHMSEEGHKVLAEAIYTKIDSWYQ